MFLYILLFLNSCLSTPSRKISTIETKEDQYWYLGFDNRLEREDRDWSLKLYYSPALDNLRKFGAYKYAQENESRNYLKDNFNNNGNSLYPQLERLLLVLFPSPDGSLSITSNSLFNLNSFISKLPSKENEKDLLTKEIVLAKILNTIYTTLSFLNLKTTEEKITAIDLIKKDSLQQLNILFSKYCENNNQIHFEFKMIESLFNPVFNFMKKESINLEEKGLIQHAFMKWALMHIGISNTDQISVLINKLPFFKNNGTNDSISISEQLFKDAGVGFSHPENIYLENPPFGNGRSYFINEKGKETKEYFSDCVETTIRHFFNYTLKKEGVFKTLPTFNQKLKKYYKDADDKKVLDFSTLGRTAWNKVVSHIPGAQYKKNGNALLGDITNILHVLEYLLTNTNQEFKKDAMIPTKIQPILNVLNNIKPLSYDKFNNNDNKYIFNNFFIINIKNQHADASVQRYNENSKKTINVDFNNFSILEYSFLTNFFSFQNHQINNSKKTIPLFNLYIHDITTILNFFDQSNKQDETYLNTFSSYIGKVLNSALWFDKNTVEKIYHDKNLVDIITKVDKKSKNILQGIQSLILKNSHKNEPEFILSSILLERSEELNNLHTVIFENASQEQSQTILKIIKNNKALIRIVNIIKQKNTINDMFRAILECVGLKNLRIENSVFEEKLPDDLDVLSNLEELRLVSNKMIGDIPNQIGNLINLIILNISHTNLTGCIPNLTNLKKLKKLRLQYNNLSGEIPINLSQLTELDTLVLSDNNLTGRIPEELVKLEKLEILGLSSNRLSGNIPKKLFASSQISLENNQLSGFIPKNIKQYAGMINPQVIINNEEEIEKLYDLQIAEN